MVGPLILHLSEESIYQDHVMCDDDAPDGDGMVCVGERVQQALLPLQAVEHLLANFSTRLDKKLILSKCCQKHVILYIMEICCR